LTGDDAGQFRISSAGALTFATGKDFEQPTDKDKNGFYSVSVVSSNPSSNYKTVTKVTVDVEFSEIFGTTSTNENTRGNDKIIGTVGWDTINGRGGKDTLSGSWGLDIFKVSDGYSIITDFNMITSASKPTKLNEILIVSADAIVDVTLKAPWVATPDSENLGTVNLNAWGNAVDLSAISGGVWNVKNGGAAAKFVGTQGDDSLIGGRGQDTLSGGDGSDTFRFGGTTETDRITDFVSGTDRIELDSNLFDTLGKGGLDSKEFLLGNVATNEDERLIYDQSKGALYYDADGSGIVVPVLIGSFDNQAVIVLADFTVV
jgi:Ca2+-binding RTX toxin-like protein